MKTPRILYNIILITLILVSTVSATDNIIINTSDGNVSFKPDNTTGFLNMSSGVFSSIIVNDNYLILNNTFRINSTANITISNVDSTQKSFNASGTTGTINIGFWLNKPTNATLLVDSVETGTPIFTTMDGWANFSYSGWSEHNFSVTDDAPELYTPPNNSNFDIVFPDLTDDIFFSWSLPPGYASNLQVAEDSAFNTIAYDETITNSNHTIALGAGVYKWRVRFYDIAAEQYYAWGNVFNFTVTSTPPTLTGTSIYGVVYKLVDGVQTPISSAEVRLWDNLSSTSYSTTTGSNGYFAFENLANYKTYYLQAKKPSEYDDSAIELITTGSGTQTEKNLLMVDCTVAYNCFYGKVNLKLIVADIWTNTYENIAIAVYAGSDVIASYTGTTGSDGSETFSLVKTQQYRITFINATQGISETRTITPGDQNELYIIVSPSGGNWWNPPSTVGNTGFTVSTNEINSTHAYVNATYTDNLAASTWTIYLNQTNHSNGTAPQIIIQSTTGSNNGTASFMISNYKGMSYLVNLKATHTTLGTIQRSFGVAFEGLQSTALDFISNFMKMLISIAIIIFVGAMFGQSSVNQGALVVCGLGWLFLGIGFFAYFDTVKMEAGLLIATVFAVFMNMNARARQEDIS